MSELSVGITNERLRLSRQHLSALESDIIGSGDIVTVETDQGGKTYVIGSSVQERKGIADLLREHFDDAITPSEIRDGASVEAVRERRKDFRRDEGVVGIFGAETLVKFMKSGITLCLLYADLDDKGRMINVPIQFLDGEVEYLLSSDDIQALAINEKYQGFLEPGVSDNPSIVIYNFKKQEPQLSLLLEGEGKVSTSS